MNVCSLCTQRYEESSSELCDLYEDKDGWVVLIKLQKDETFKYNILAWQFKE